MFYVNAWVANIKNYSKEQVKKKKLKLSTTT